MKANKRNRGYALLMKANKRNRGYALLMKANKRNRGYALLMKANKRNRGYALLMKANIPERVLYRASIFSLLLVSHGGSNQLYVLKNPCPIGTYVQETKCETGG